MAHEGTVLKRIGKDLWSVVEKYYVPPSESKGQVITLAGGQEEACVDGPPSEARFCWPQAICVDSKGNLFVADTDNHKIRKITPDGQVTSLKIYGALETGGTDNKEVTFSGPKAVCLDQQEKYLFMVGSVGAIGKLDLKDFGLSTPAVAISICPHPEEGVFLTAWGNTDVALHTLSSVHKSKAQPVPFPLGLGGHICTDPSGKIIYFTGTNRVYSKDPYSDAPIRLIAGSENPGFLDGVGEAASFGDIAGICCDPRGNLWIADKKTTSVRLIILPEGKVTTLHAKRLSRDDELSQAGFTAPSGICVDRQGNVYVTESNRIRKICQKGVSLVDLLSTMEQGMPFKF